MVSIMNQKQTVLIVDDELLNLTLLEAHLTSADYLVSEARDGDEALDKAIEGPDLILLDIMMPGMDGFETCRRLKEIERTKDIPVIFLSADQDANTKLNCFSIGGVDYITKPFESNELLARIKTHLTLRKQELQLLEMVDKLQKSNEQLKENEIKIRELNQLLEMRVEDRTEKLSDAQSEILRKEYKSELADITSETLHNVKNILNSVKTSAEKINQIFVTGSIKYLKKANDILKEHMDNIEDFMCNNPKGKKLLQYYLSLEESFENESENTKKHLERLKERVDAMEKITVAQQEYSGGSLIEEVIVKKIIEDALVMQTDLIEAYNIKVETKISNVPSIRVQKTKLIHILINLIKNARDAMIGTPEALRILSFLTEIDNNSIILKITDTGHGISPENLGKMFVRGFTTKADGHGYGLHSCASYMKEMSGEMYVESEGEGKGATFVLKLPL